MNPGGPSGAAGPPTSFKTNVNRAKTKRWVEAKSYSYDGDDWGEVDDYDEYGGYEPGPAKPTGLRQQGQSASPMAGALQSQPQILESPVEAHEQQYIAPGGRPSKLQQEFGGQSAISSQLYQRPNQAKTNSVGQGEERRGLSAGPPPYGVPYGGPSSGPSSGPFQQDQAPPEQIIQMRMPPQGPQLYQQPNQNRSRPSLDSQSRPIGQGPPISYHGVSYSDRPRQAGDGSRTHSMTSSTSSQEFHNRRDFSPSAMPQPLHSQNRETLLRGSSLGQEDTPGAGIGSPSSGNIQAPYGNPNIAAAAALADNKDQSELAGKPLPFVRPADIYKRMAEERERERQSQESSRPSMGAITGSRPPLPRDVSPSQSGGRPNLDVAASVPRAQRSFDVGDDSEGVNRGKPQLDSVAERRSEYGLEGMQTSHANPAGDSGSSTAVTPSQPQILASPDQGLLGSPQLPNVPRMSGFGESFMGSIQNGYGDLPDFSREKEQSGDQLKPSVHLSPQEASASPLQHQPSLGYRSVVSKAFEDQQMPSTPTSTSDSAVARSNSESTNAISPIMSRAPSAVSPETRLREAGGRENNVPIIAEESGVGTPRPNSEEPTTTSRPVTRKLSPSSGSPIELSGSQNFATDSGHRRQISSPSPDNSPARTPAFEVNRRFQQPQYAELSVTTPTSMTHTVSTVSNVLPQASNNNAENSASQSQSAIAAESPTSLTSPVVGRADSPSKGRVRNLADRFESRDVSRQGSKSSMRGSTSPQKAGSGDDDLPARPQPDRLESFRPHLPGGWESYISNAPGHPGLPGAAGNRGQASSQKYNEQGNERSMNPMIPEQSFQKMYDDEGPNPRTTDEVPNESMDITPTTEKRALPKAPEEPQSNDAFSAVAAAGAALAGAFTAAVGLDPHHSDESVPDAKPSDFTSARGRSASLKGSDFHPDAIKPWMYQDDDSASSVVPTPLSPLPEQRDKSGNSNYFPPVPPLKQRPFPINVVNETTPSRPQIYPTMSTETSPNDYESDRLRKQLVRELSPATEHFPDDSMARANEPQVEGSALQNSPSTRRQDHDSMFLPQEYDSYWNGSSSGDNVSQRTSHQEAVPQEDSSERQPDEKLPLTTAPQSIAEESYKSVEPKSESVSTNTINTIGASPRQLTHRFSWEPVLEEINAPFQVGTASDVAIATPPHTEGRDDLPKSFTKSQDPPHSTSEITYEDSKEPAKGQTNLQKELPQINDPENQEIVGSSTPIQDYQKPAPEDMPPPHIPNESEMPPFRKIVGIKDGAERIRVYKATREQFAHMRTGLDQWITATINECPEHSDLLNNGGMFGPVSGYKPSPSRGKFPGLRVTSGQQQHVNQNSHMIPPSPNSSALTNSSGYSPGAASGRSSSHQMQVKGKDLLHSAGVFGGRASNATKGLFSKGRNKFKGSSGAEKVDS
ncbi:hypothetical protein MMC13_002151 [Lambiella insularis]|nr:hypothetical protein [Lambiella insularis]